MDKNYYEHIQQILRDEKLSKEQKAQLIEQAQTNYSKSVDTERNKTVAKKLFGGALQIASAAIPIGGAGAAGAKIGQQILQKSLGKKLAREIGSGITSGAIAGGVFGAGQGLIDDKDPLKTAVKDASIGGAVGGITGGLSGKFLQNAKIKTLNELTEKRKDWGIAFRKASGNTQKAIDTLLEYKKGFVPDAFNKSGIGKGDIIWGKSGNDGYGLAHIIERRNSEGINSEEFIKQIPNDIANGNVNKNHENLGRFYIESSDNNIVIRNDYNKKPRNWLVTAYEKYDKNNSQAISGRQTSKNSFPNEQHIPSSDLGNTTIPNNFNDFNPSHVAIPASPIFTGSVSKNVDLNGNELTNLPFDSNRIFTREDIASMTKDEYLQNENAINFQWGKIGIPTNGDMEREMITNGNVVYVKPYTRQDGTKVKGYYRSK